MTTKTEGILPIRENPGGPRAPTERQLRYAEHLAAEAKFDAETLRKLIDHRTSGRASSLTTMTRAELGLLIDWLLGDIRAGITPEDRIAATVDQHGEIWDLAKAIGMSPMARSAFMHEALPHRTQRYPLCQRDAALLLEQMKQKAVTT